MNTTFLKRKLCVKKGLGNKLTRPEIIDDFRQTYARIYFNPKNALEIFPLLSPNKISFHNRNSSAAEEFIVRSAGATHTCNILKSLYYISTNLNTLAPAVGNKNLIITVVAITISDGSSEILILFGRTHIKSPNA